MFGNPYYHQTTKRVITAFGTIFNNVNIVREDRNANEMSRIKVPLAYQNKKAWHRILKEYSDRDEDQVTVQGYFPRMSFNIQDMTPLKESQTTSPKHINRSDGQGGITQTMLRTKYRLTFELAVIAKTQEDLYQIIEQILPVFTPSVSVSLKSSRLLGANALDDLIFSLQDISIDDELEFSYEEAYGLQLNTRYLTFTTEVIYYGPTESASGIIKTADVTFIQGNTGKPMSQVIVELDPSDSEATSFGISSGVFLLDNDFNLITSATLGTTSGLLDC